MLKNSLGNNLVKNGLELNQHDFPASGCPHSTLWRRSRPLSRRGAPPWSCADILIYAARDTGSILGNGRVNFDVPVGRLDCLVSSADEAQAEIPDPTLTLQQLIDNFITKTFTVEEVVILSGAHSVGDNHCSSFVARLAALPDQITPASPRPISPPPTARPPVVRTPAPGGQDSREAEKKRKKRGI
ncbi:peroxidase 2-like [Oryza brachyantha]|uniref:peroxidase 2-like n=1 Tax=Oryza brachyantha TaxID=4533 RepID=UPI00077623E0|nr:peroxidase 2-like [Oryza brachyantha]